MLNERGARRKLRAIINGFTVDGLWHSPVGQKSFLTEVQIRQIAGLNGLAVQTEGSFRRGFDLLKEWKG